MRRYDIDSLDNRDAAFIERTARFLNGPLRAYFRYEIEGMERIPEGAALYVGNHSGGLTAIETFLFFGACVEHNGLKDLPYGLGHEVVLSLPGFQQLVVPLGAVRASHDTAHRIFEAGGKVMVYPGGDYDAFRPFRHRHRVVFGGRTGFVRLALRERVPIVPVATAGTHSTFVILDDLRWLAPIVGLDRLLRVKVVPVALSIPWGLTIGPTPTHFPLPSRVLAEVLEPVRFDRTGADAAEDEPYVRACADRVERAIQASLDRLTAKRREKSLRRRFARVLRAG